MKLNHLILVVAVGALSLGMLSHARSNIYAADPAWTTVEKPGDYGPFDWITKGTLLKSQVGDFDRVWGYRFADGTTSRISGRFRSFVDAVRAESTDRPDVAHVVVLDIPSIWRVLFCEPGDAIITPQYAKLYGDHTRAIRKLNPGAVELAQATDLVAQYSSLAKTMWNETEWNCSFYVHCSDGGVAVWELSGRANPFSIEVATVKRIEKKGRIPVYMAH